VSSKKDDEGEEAELYDEVSGGYQKVVNHRNNADEDHHMNGALTKHKKQKKCKYV
jgi:hypothetical protein